MVLHFTEKKNYLQAFYTFEIKLSLIVLVFFDTNQNTNVDVFAKKLIIFSTTLLLNKCWQINITQHQCKDLTVCIPTEHKVYKIEASLHDQQSVYSFTQSTQAIFLPWSIPIILACPFQHYTKQYKYICCLLSKHVHKYVHHLQVLQMKSIPSEDHTALPWTWLTAR